MSDLFAEWLAETERRKREDEPAVEIHPLRDSNETNSRFPLIVSGDAARPEEQHIEHVVELHSPPRAQAPLLGPPQVDARGFQPELDDFQGDLDTDDDDDNGPMDVVPVNDDEADVADFLDPTRFRAPGSHDYGEPYQRPAVVDILDGPLEFMHVDSSYCIDPDRLTPTVRLWGVTEAGHSVLLEDDHFLPYFYVEAGKGDTHERMVRLSEQLNQFLRSSYSPQSKNGKVPGGKFVVRIESGQGRSMCGYHMDAPMGVFYKFVMAHPAHVAAARNSLEYANRAVTERPYKTYEANVLFELRWLIDKRINGCQWIRLPAGSYSATPVGSRHSNCQYELKLNRDAVLEPLDLSVKDAIPPLRTLSYDIEVLRRERGFPEATRDPCIMVACALAIAGRGIVHRAVFTVRNRLSGGFGPIDDPDDEAEVYVYNSERALLLAFRQYVLACDPEFLTGWNTDNFDMPYLAERARQCGIGKEFLTFGRLLDKPAWLRKSTTTSKAHGSRETTELLCEGRIAFDALIYVLKMVMKKFRSYTLNAIAKALLGQQKLDIHHSQIPVLYDSADDADRTRLAQYCMRDALLPLLLLDKLMAIINCVEQARIAGVLIRWILGGQGRKTFSLILRSKDPDQHSPSRAPKTNTVITGGGHVEDPIRGYYLTPIASLDFSSLYPSIIIAYNICYTTKVPLAWALAHLQPDDYWVPFPSVDRKTPEELERERTQGSGKAKSKKERDREAAEEAVAGKPTSYVFVKAHIYEGVLPRMLKRMLGYRSHVRKVLMVKPENAADPMKMFVLDGRQNQIKVMCNSVYGFTKGFIWADYELMASVTSYGRNMLRIVKRTIAEQFSNVPVTDVAACRAANLDPEDETIERPKRLATVFIVYGGKNTRVCVLHASLTRCVEIPTPPWWRLATPPRANPSPLKSHWPTASRMASKCRPSVRRSSRRPTRSSLRLSSCAPCTRARSVTRRCKSSSTLRASAWRTPLRVPTWPLRGSSRNAVTMPRLAATRKGKSSRSYSSRPTWRPPSSTCGTSSRSSWRIASTCPSWSLPRG